MNSPYFIDCEQGTKAWFDARLGDVSSTRIKAVTAKRQKASSGKSIDAPLQCRIDIKWEIVAERLTGKVPEHYVSEWMKEGREREPLARSEYELRRDCMVDTVGYAQHPSIKRAGASPDGIVNDCALIEIKCPKLETHVQYLRDGRIPELYLPQMTWQLACVPDAQWNDFVSFHPDLPEEYQLFVRRLPRSKEVDALIAAYELEVEQFNREVDEELAALRERVREAVEV